MGYRVKEPYINHLELISSEVVKIVFKVIKAEHNFNKDQDDGNATDDEETTVTHSPSPYFCPSSSSVSVQILVTTEYASERKPNPSCNYVCAMWNIYGVKRVNNTDY